jgi:transcriptional regulator with XRE-family HTH domain
MSESFGSLISSWRQQRRMSQLDLAMTANVSARHISFLETGRANPSRSMVLALSESLGVPRATRNVLLTAAGFAQTYRARDLDEDEMVSVREAMDWMLERHCPYPAVAVDRHWRLKRTNAVAAALLQGMQLGVGDNLLDALLEGGAFAEALLNAGEVAHHLARRIRTESAHLGGDALLDRAATRLSTMSAESSPDAHDAMPAIIPARFRFGDQVLSLFSTIAQFGSTEDIALADLKIELMFPADDSTRAALHANFAAA